MKTLIAIQIFEDDFDYEAVADDFMDWWLQRCRCEGRDTSPVTCDVSIGGTRLITHADDEYVDVEYKIVNYDEEE